MPGEATKAALKMARKTALAVLKGHQQRRIDAEKKRRAAVKKKHH